VPGERRRADVDGDAVRLVDESRPDGDDRTVPDRHRRCSAGDRHVQRRQHGGVERLDLVAVLVVHGRSDEVGSRRSRAEAGSGDLDIAQGERRIDVERRQVEGGEVLAHDLAVDLAGRRHVDHDVAADRRGAAETVPGSERAAPRVVAFERRPLVELPAGRRDLPFGERADRRHHLTASADATAAAHAVEVDAEQSRRGEHGRAVDHLAGAS
jgi:hypothetical protein